jgi:HAD superfamily phosphoserine phosphatase-like hydrolase
VHNDKEVKEIKEVEGVKEKSRDASRVAAFFDLDGTLMPLPSMEQRFFCILRRRGEIPRRNYLLWLKEGMRLTARGIQRMLQTNKMYLRGVKKIDRRDADDSEIFPVHKSGQQSVGQESAPVGCVPASLLCDSRLPVPAFFEEAMERVARHAMERHEIVLMSGTLEPLAREAARSMEAKLATRGIGVTIRVIATRLEEKDGRWTGRISGEAMFGEAKAKAALRLAVEMRLDLRRCYAYGDSLNDRWLMEAVGRPEAVNPSKGLARIAGRHRWPILGWEEKENLTRRRKERREIAERKKTAPQDCGVELARPESRG